MQQKKFDPKKIKQQKQSINIKEKQLIDIDSVFLSSQKMKSSEQFAYSNKKNPSKKLQNNINEAKQQCQQKLQSQRSKKRKNRKNKQQLYLFHNLQNINVVEPKKYLLQIKDISLYLSNVIIKTHPIQSKEQSQILCWRKKIRPIAKQWKTWVRQHLNENVFVEIFRGSNTTNNHNIRYGQTIIDYQKLNYKIFSRAYFKIVQIIYAFKLVDNFINRQCKIACLAEGPGGFIQAFIQHIPSLEIKAITLKVQQNNPSSQDWGERRASNYFNSSKCPLQLSYGIDGTGNLLNIANIKHFVGTSSQEYDLITGDGGVECTSEMQMQDQQLMNAKLFYAQVYTAFLLQKMEGNFVVKIYTMSCSLTAQIITLLCIHYRSVFVYKPRMSRPGNSEKYIVCQKFKGISQLQANQLKQIYIKWMETQKIFSYHQNRQFVHSLLTFENKNNYEQIFNQLKQIDQQYNLEQIQMIKQGIYLVQNITEEQKTQRIQQQINYSYLWCRKHKIPTIYDNDLNNN